MIRDTSGILPIIPVKLDRGNFIITRGGTIIARLSVDVVENRGSINRVLGRPWLISQVRAVCIDPIRINGSIHANKCRLTLGGILLYIAFERSFQSQEENISTSPRDENSGCVVSRHNLMFQAFGKKKISH